MRTKLLLVIMLLSAFLGYPKKINAVYSLTGSNSLSNISGTTLPITDLQISGSGSEPIPVKLRVTSGSLSIGNTTGLTFTGSRTGSTIYFSGTMANLNTSLSTLVYTRSGSGSDTLEVSLVESGEVFFSDNGHLYKFITTNITANNAKTAATSQTAYGATGYLATITSQAENDFVAARLQGDGWMGASDAATEGDWKWTTGPESGTSFWSGAASGSPVSSRYSNWASGEPNDYSTGEDCAQFYISTGKWNDLPCSGTTLSGYVVEFGATGDMPTVVAKNISITTLPTYTLTYTAGINGSISGISPQTVVSGSGGSSVTPVPGSHYHFVGWSDGSTSNPRTDLNVNRNIGVTANFSIDTYTITFTAGSHGSISGSTTQTVNYGADTTSVTAVGDSGYHFTSWSDNNVQNPRQILMVTDNKSVTANFVADDSNAPVVSDINVSSDSGSASITWVTNESSSSLVQYGLHPSYGFATTKTDTSPGVTSHSISLANLKSCARYYYRVISADDFDNQSASAQKTFNTTGCVVSTITTGTETTLPVTGGTVQLINNLSTAKLDVPNSYASEAATFQINKLDTSQAPAAPSGMGIAANNFYDLLAVTNTNQQLDTFSNPITFTITYGSDTETNYDESTLDVYKYDGTNWVKKDCTLDITANTLTCNLSGFSTYAVLGDTKADSSTNGNSNTASSTSSGSSVCNDSSPVLIPDLFQINTSTTSATLFFTPIDVSRFYISFSENPDAERYGTDVTLAREGVQNFTINLLKPNTTYYLKIRGQNGCMPGSWSNVLRFTTDSSIFYEHGPTKSKPTSSRFPSIVDVPSSVQDVIPSPTQAPVVPQLTNNVKPEPKAKSCFLWWCW